MPVFIGLIGPEAVCLSRILGVLVGLFAPFGVKQTHFACR